MAGFGITETQAAMMDSNAALLAGSPAQQCEAGLLMYRGAAELAPTVVANVAAFMVYQQSTP